MALKDIKFIQKASKTTKIQMGKMLPIYEMNMNEKMHAEGYFVVMHDDCCDRREI